MISITFQRDHTGEWTACDDTNNALLSGPLPTFNAVLADMRERGWFISDVYNIGPGGLSWDENPENPDASDPAELVFTDGMYLPRLMKTEAPK